MHPARARRLILIIIMLIGIFSAVGFAVYAFRQNLMFYFTPTEVAAGKAPAHKLFRMGGMVVKGSVIKAADSVNVRFDLTDFQHKVTVSFDDILPDLFREGQGIIAKGRLNDKGVFVAEEVLAKHDEKYMPPEVAASLKQNNQLQQATP